MKELLTVKEAANYLRLQEKALRNSMSQGRFPIPFVRFGRNVRFRKIDIEKAMEEGIQNGSND